MAGRAQGRVLVIAHREELLDQARDRVQTAFPGISVGVEQAGRTTEPDDQVVIASIQTLASSPRRLHKLDPTEFSLVVVDEAHHAAARTYLDRYLSSSAASIRHSRQIAERSQQKRGHTLVLSCGRVEKNGCCLQQPTLRGT